MNIKQRPGTAIELRCVGEGIVTPPTAEREPEPAPEHGDEQAKTDKETIDDG